MQYRTYSLEEFSGGKLSSGQNVTLTAYLTENFREIEPERRRPAVLILPGGGYAFTSDREAEPVALRFLAGGVNAFVLRYSCAPARYPQALMEAAAAVSFLRENAEEWSLMPAGIFVCGFSAGGHLAVSLGTGWRPLRETFPACRPDGMILCYPVIDAGEYAHEGSFRCLLDGQAGAEALGEQSLQTKVLPDTPPAFLWHTADDPSVPVQNTLLFAQALAAKGIPFETHIYPHGVHGLGLSTEQTAPAGSERVNPRCARWMEECLLWMKGVSPRH